MLALASVSVEPGDGCIRKPNGPVSYRLSSRFRARSDRRSHFQYVYSHRNSGCVLRVSDRNGGISGIGIQYTAPNVSIGGQSFTPVLGVEAYAPMSPFAGRVSRNQDSMGSTYSRITGFNKPTAPPHVHSKLVPITSVPVTGPVRLNAPRIPVPHRSFCSSPILRQVYGTVGLVSRLSGNLLDAFRPAAADCHVQVLALSVSPRTGRTSTPLRATVADYQASLLAWTAPSRTGWSLAVPRSRSTFRTWIGDVPASASFPFREAAVTPPRSPRLHPQPAPPRFPPPYPLRPTAPGSSPVFFILSSDLFLPFPATTFVSCPPLPRKTILSHWHQIVAVGEPTITHL